MGRKLLAALLGALAYFLWSGLAHMVLPLGEAGLKEMPNEAPITAAMKAGLPDRGLYVFPGTGLPANASQSEKRAAMDSQFKKTASGPSGILMFHPARDFSFGSALGTEFFTNVLQVLLAVILLSQTRLWNFAARWGFMVTVGLLVAISTNISYWNWYGFPITYTLSYAFTIFLGFVLAGLVVAAIVKPGAGMPASRGAGA